MKIRRVRYEMFYRTNIFTTATTSGKYHQIAERITVKRWPMKMTDDAITM